MGSRTSRRGAAELTWDPQERLATLRFVDASGAAGGPEAEQLTDHLDRWLEEGPPGPFRLLVDCTQIGALDAAWRQRWADFFLVHRERATLAWFNANPEVALIVTMFRKATGVRGETFPTEDGARRYLEASA